MQKLKMQTPNMAEENFKKLKELFPEAVTEIEVDGVIKPAIDKDVLQQLISNEVVEGPKERYQFTWPGKHEAMLLAGKPTNKTLRPVKGENPIDDACFNTTQNLYIEGDNLEVLKILETKYAGKIKMIYIDPPYNTGNDFIYKDKFDTSRQEYLLENNGERDDDGNRLVKNMESNGRFHSDWLSMMYPRLIKARNLLSDDGGIFISIGDDEEANLIKLCDEIFGEKNFIASICHKHRASVSNDRIISENHNHLVFYSKNIEIMFENQKLIGEDPVLEGFNNKDENGFYKFTPVDGPGGAKKGNPHYEFLGVTGYWRYSFETMQEKYKKGLIVRTPNGLQQKYYKSQAEKSRRTVTTWWDEDFLTSSATKQLADLLNGKVFDNPKSLKLIIRTLKMLTKFSSDCLVLDFFSGSATTAHAVMQLNAEDGGHRKFIMVQLPEPCDEKSEAYKAGYKNICEIGKERIRRAGKKILEELKKMRPQNASGIAGAAATDGGVQASDRMSASRRAGEQSETEGVLNNEELAISNEEFKGKPLCQLSMTSTLKKWSIKEVYQQWGQICKERFNQLKSNEEELNRIFIDIYGLNDELTPEVEDKDVTVRKADLQREVRSFISYAVGCMMGRYSLDCDGLAFAGGEWDKSKYTSFIPDEDGIIPITDDEYFNDDIVGRFIDFVKVVYGEGTLEDNLKFIADAIGGKGSARQIIRNYFIGDFFADHVKVYQKRPIYWLFDSGKKNGFKCLIYMHRYQPDTLARIRTDYVHEQQARYRTVIADLEQRINGASTSERVKLNKQLTKIKDQAEEIRLYEEKIHHLADQMIKIDLDDGVKHNYAIFESVLAKIK